MTHPTDGDPIPSAPNHQSETVAGDTHRSTDRRSRPKVRLLILLLLLLAAGFVTALYNIRPPVASDPQSGPVAAPRSAISSAPIDPASHALLTDYLVQIDDAEAIDDPSRVDAEIVRALHEPSKSGQFWAGLGERYRANLSRRSAADQKVHALPLDTLFDRALHCAANEPAILRSCANHLTATGRHVKGQAVLRNLISISPADAHLYLLLADSQRTTGEFSEARESLDAYLALNPKDLQATITMANLLVKELVDYPAALEFCKAARQRFPQDRYLRYANAQALVGNFRADEALAELEELATTAPSYDAAVTGDPEFGSFLGMAQQKSGASDAAEMSYRKAIAVAPVSATDAYHNLALLQLETATPTEETLELARKAVELQKDNPRYRNTLGQCLFRLGQYSEALAEFIQVRSLEKKPNPQTLKHLGDTYEKMGRLTQARSSWRQASKLAPNDPELEARVARSANY